MRYLRYIFSLIIIANIQLSQALNIHELLINAAEGGDKDAQKQLVENYLNGDRGFSINLEEAYKWAESLAQNGDADAQYGLATDPRLKSIVENRGKGQIFWLEQSALSNHPKGLEDYGVFLFNNQEYDKAIPFLQNAVTKGYSLYSMFLLAEIDYHGYLGKENKEFAIKQYQMVVHLSELIEEQDKERIYIIPDYVIDSYNNIARILIEEKDYKTALLKINKAFDKTTWSESSLNYLNLLDTRATIYLLAEYPDRCKKDWEKIISTMPDYAKERNTFLTNVMTGNVDYLIPSVSTISDNTLAIIIANENYKRVPNVPHAINDGAVFKKYLTSTFGVPEENIEYLEDASLNDIKYALSNVCQRCEAFKDQMNVIVYYAGHGVPDDKTNEAYLLPVDGFGTDPKSGLNMDDFYESLSEMPAKSVIVLLDACFSGVKRDGGMLMATRGITIKPNMKVPDGKLIVLSATAEDQTAFPIEDQKHGLFTYTLLRKIQETNGDITWGELADYVTETVKTRSIDLAGKLQSPTVSVSPSIKDSWRNQKIR